MKAKRVLVNFGDLKETIQSYADEYCDGNFNMAVRQLIRKGLLKC